jgi:streptogramin lyase
MHTLIKRLACFTAMATVAGATMLAPLSAFAQVPFDTITEGSNTQPEGMAIDSNGNVWVANFGNLINTVQEIPVDSTSSSTLPAAISMGSGTSPIALAIDSSDNIWVVNFGTNTVQEIPVGSTSSSTLPAAISMGSNKGPEAIAIDSNDNFWVTNHLANTVQEIPAGSTSSSTLPAAISMGSGTSPQSIAVDSNDNLWVTNFFGSSIQEIPAGSTSTSTLPAAISDGKTPDYVVVDSDNNLWTTENVNTVSHYIVSPSVITNSDGSATATVSTGEDLSSVSYSVPSKQTLIVDGSLGAVTVQSGGTLKGGAGTSPGSLRALTINSGGTLSPGHSPGCLTDSGTLSIAGTYQDEVGGTTVCSGYDQMQMTGTGAQGAVTINSGAVLNPSLVNGFVPSAGQSFDIITGATSVAGTFNDLSNTALTEGATFTSQGVTYKITYLGGTGGHDVVLTVSNVNAAVAQAAAAAAAGKVPGTPNTGFMLVSAHPAATLGVSVVIAMTLVYIARRLKPAVKG